MPMITPGYYTPTNWSYYGMNPPVPQQSFAQVQPQQNTQGMIWVDGESSAKAFQMPGGLPAGTVIALWDTSEPIVYWKTINQAGIPVIVNKFRYSDESNQSQMPIPVPGTVSSAPAQQDYVTKEDIEQMKLEIRELKEQLAKSISNANGQNNQNRGGNR